MDLTHLHLIITHLPIYGSILGTLVLMYGMVAKSHHTKMAAYFVLLIAALGGIVALILSIVCVGMSSWTGYLGGKIRHTEVSNVMNPFLKQ